MLLNKQYLVHMNSDAKHARVGRIQIANEQHFVSLSRRSSSATQAFTLLEVILAIAILAISLAAVGEVIRSAFGNAANAADGLEARLVAQSIIDQIKCGAIEIADAGPMQMGSEEALGHWAVQILVEATSVEELMQVRVLVGQSLDAGERPACELVRWFQNPDFATAAAASTTTTSQ